MHNISFKTKLNKLIYKKSSYYFLYTIFFLIMICIIFAPFYLNNKSFVWHMDGLTQHLPALTYTGNWLRQIFENIFIHHNFSIPMWDMSIGYGSDIITTLHYYAIGDPLNLLAVFVPSSKMEYLYCGLVLLRLYLAGITFSMYCRKMKKSTFAILVGAVIYVFSGYAMYISVRHPYFVNPMIYLPILLIGIEKIFKKEKPYVFIIATTISAVSNFYFFYMLAILIFVYAIFRYVMIFKKIELKELLCWIGKFCGYFLIGSCIAMIIFLPNAMLVLGSSRYGVEKHIPLLYFEQHYYSTFLSFISAKQTGAYTNLNFSAVALTSIFVLFVQKKEKISLKIGLILTTVFYLIPFFGYFLNGFASSQNRWIWGYAMLVAYITVEMIPKFFELTKKQRLIILAFTVLYTIIYVFCEVQLNNNSDKCVFSALAILIVSILFLMTIGTFIRSKRLIQTLLLGLTCLGIGINAYFIFSEKQGNYISEFKDIGTFYSTVMQTPSSLLKNINDDSIYRYDRDKGNGELFNTAMLQNLYSVGYRFSMADGDISQFYEENFINTARDYSYLTLDNRTVLETLASVKYFMIKEGRTQDLPYGYTKLIESKETNGIKSQVYSTENSLPLGYTYSNYIKSDTYNSLSVTEKQWAFLQGVVLDNNVTENTSLKEAVLNFTAKNIPYTITPDNNTKVEGTKIITTKANATVTLNFKGLSNSETYLILDEIGISKDMLSGKYNIKVNGEYKTKNVELLTERERAYCGRNSFLCNLDYNKNACTKIKLTFSAAGEYSFKELAVVCQPMDGFENLVNDLKEDTLENIKLNTNKISGTINLENSKVLVMSIPYSKGWTAYVDGKKQEVVRANSMYMGLLLDKGEHKIVFKYHSPYLEISSLISVFGIIAFCIIIIYHKKRAKNNIK